MDKHRHFITALEQANQEAAEARRKKELKLWNNLSLPYSLEEALAQLTKTELTAIRQNLRLKKISSLNKAELIHELSLKIPEQMEDLLYLMDEERYNFILQIVKNKGAVETRDLNLEKAEYLRSLGLFFPSKIHGERFLTMPVELIEQFKKLEGSRLKKQIRRNTELIQLTHGLLNYYGVLQVTQIEEKIKELTQEEVDPQHLIRLLFHTMRYYQRIRPTYHVGFYDARIDDPERILTYHKHYAELDFYPFSKAQILKASDPYHVDVTPALKALIDYFVTHFAMTHEEAGEIALDCADFFQYDLSPLDIFKFLVHEVGLTIPSERVKEDLHFLLFDLSISTRLWVLKGYTYDELFTLEKRIPGTGNSINSQSQKRLSESKPLPPSVPSPPNSTSLRNSSSLSNSSLLPKDRIPMASHKAKIIDFKTRKPIGPDDPCPCGSGARLKDCCLRSQ